MRKTTMTNQANGRREAERRIALMEGARNYAETHYMQARPHYDTEAFRKVFCDAFERGYQAAISSPQGAQCNAIAAARAEAYRECAEMAAEEVRYCDCCDAPVDYRQSMINLRDYFRECGA